MVDDDDSGAVGGEAGQSGGGREYVEVRRRRDLRQLVAQLTRLTARIAGRHRLEHNEAEDLNQEVLFEYFKRKGSGPADVHDRTEAAKLTAKEDSHGGDAASISEDDARKLLARAAELDARGAVSIQLAQLRASAAEAGISQEAFARALADLRAGNLEPRTVGQAVASRLARYRRPAFALCYLAAAFITPGDFILPTVILTLALFGAYEGFLLLARWFGRQPGPPRPAAIEDGNPLATPARTPREESDSRMRLLVFHGASGPAA